MLQQKLRYFPEWYKRITLIRASGIKRRVVAQSEKDALLQAWMNLIHKNFSVIPAENISCLICSCKRASYIYIYVRQLIFAAQAFLFHTSILSLPQMSASLDKIFLCLSFNCNLKIIFEI